MRSPHCSSEPGIDSSAHHSYFIRDLLNRFDIFHSPPSLVDIADTYRSGKSARSCLSVVLNVN